MNLIERQRFLFQNRGIPHENNLNIIGLVLSSRKITHSVPVSINIDAHAYAQACGNGSEEVMADVIELWTAADALGLKYKRVEAKVALLGRQYLVEFFCYGD